MQWFRDKLDLPSRVKFYLWRLSGNSFEAALKMKNGFMVLLRPKPFHDVAIATEVFATNLYNIPDQINHGDINFIVDIGANVGFTCVHWLSKFPKATITAFEPHPNHITQINKHIEANSAVDKVKLISKAAGTERGEVFLTNEEYLSTLINDPVEGAIAVEVADWIAEIGNRAIDLLKIDIEGSEYLLLSDERFGKLNIQVCVLEWHNTDQYPNGRIWCEERLTRLDYQVCRGELDNLTNGVLWAWKK